MGVSGSGKTRMVQNFVYGGERPSAAIPDVKGLSGARKLSSVSTASISSLASQASTRSKSRYQYIPTFVDHYTKRVNNDTIVEVIDTGGLEHPQVQEVLPGLLKDADGVIFVYNTWRGFTVLCDWISMLQSQRKRPAMVMAFDEKDVNFSCPFGLFHSPRAQAFDLLLSIMGIRPDSTKSDRSSSQIKRGVVRGRSASHLSSKGEPSSMEELRRLYRQRSSVSTTAVGNSLKRAVF
ncbi:hypothetical protein FOL47_002302 [Perkinsus chesapeaki]|uniref:Uncharacterized protein n=1 Tax=Perkinsus chesapeaki TaxID=330153 RepID=A0A7J6MEE9_PERCH|nr:hypothetical protein FOL47_002302 [Perkinsus chesapeaki]